MANAQQEKIARMEWDDLEKRLQSPTRGTARADTSEDAMRQYFGDEEFEYLRQLADHAQAMRTRAGVLGSVILLPGIMGTNLESIEGGGDRDLVWVNIFRLAWGQAERLKLTADGKREANAGIKIFPSVIDKRTYARALVYLGARWRVLPFPFDWRKDIDASADALADFIKANSNGQPVHLVAHSMGGLVCRNFIRRHKDVWEKIADDEGARGGRLVMLGTPNYGSFAIPQAMKGTEKLVRWLEKADIKHDMNGLLAILNSFVGSYQMLPAPDKIPESAQVIYRAENWREPTVSAIHLKRAMDFHAQLSEEETVSPERMVYIAGCNRETLTGLKMVAPGEFDYTSNFNGDGRVPFELGILPNVRTYYVDEAHGDLPRNELVLTAVDEILSTGLTNTLAASPPVLRALKPGAVRARHTVADQQLGNEVERIAQESRERRADPEEERVAEELIMQATQGQDQKTEHAAVLEKGRKTRERKKARRKLQIRVVLGDIARVAAPVIVCGHYKGVAPKRAEASLDKALHYWISRANEHRMIGADLGQLFFIPVNRKQIAARAILLAGMGEEGSFGRDDLRYLMLNVTYALSVLDVESYATVLMGSSRNNMSIERALRSLLFGICDALSRLPRKIRLKTLLLVEKDKSRHKCIVDALKKIKGDESAAQLDITVRSEKPKNAMARGGGPERPYDLMPEDEQRGVRITVERAQTVEGGAVKDVFRLSAMTDSAVIPVRESNVQPFFVEGIADHLMGARTIKEQEMFGKLLYSYLIPEDFGRIIDNDTPLTLVLDRSTASFPWEMACFGGINGNVFFGPSLQLARQFRTLLSSSPAVAPPLNRRLRVLVIADPAPEPQYQLAGARLEGREVVKVFQSFKRNNGLDIEVVDRIGADECDPVELLGLILNEEFDVVHFAGHGYFDEKDPNLGGWVFGKDCFLTPMEIFKARRVPRLVFANACYSSVIREGQPLSADEMNKRLAGLAESFFERGVQNYVGAGWPVEDDPGVLMAKTFYENALKGETLGASLSAARRDVMKNYMTSTWGAYQHYGQVNAVLVTKEED